jgi:hypothetical protein
MSAIAAYRWVLLSALFFTVAGMQGQVAKPQNSPAVGHSLTARAPAPQFIEPRRKNFSGIVTVKLAESDPRCTIYYTTDGSDPLVNGPTYTGAFSVKRGTRVRAVAKWPGHLSSEVVSHTFR